MGSRVITLTVTHTVAAGYTGADRISGSVTLGNDAVGLMTANIRSWYWEPRRAGWHGTRVGRALTRVTGTMPPAGVDRNAS